MSKAEELTTETIGFLNFVKPSQKFRSGLRKSWIGLRLAICSFLPFFQIYTLPSQKQFKKIYNKRSLKRLNHSKKCLFRVLKKLNAIDGVKISTSIYFIKTSKISLILI